MSFFFLAINLALNKPAFQSSDHTNMGVASKAVDGITDTNFHAGHCSHTQINYNAWWAVDLGEERKIAAVEITNRGDSYGKSAKDSHASTD